MSISKRYIFAIIFMLFLSSIYILVYRPFPLKKYNYLVPKDELIVGIEGGEKSRIFTRILEVAFPDYKIIYTNDRPPHLIMKSALDTKALLKWDAPYIVWSGERYAMKKHRVRRNGQPIAEIISRKPKKKNQFYFPFVLESINDLENIRQYNQTGRKKFVAYISRNCMPHREQFFQKLKQYNSSADALGECSNPEGKTIPGDWRHLTEVYKDYRFGFAMENYDVPLYITEKIMNIYKSGAIPIFWGDNESVTEFFNPRSFVNLNNFKNFDQALNYIAYLDSNIELLEKMQQEPIFRDNKVPEIFKIYQDPPNKYVKECAEYIRKEFFKAIM